MPAEETERGRIERLLVEITQHTEKAKAFLLSYLTQRPNKDLLESMKRELELAIIKTKQAGENHKDFSADAKKMKEGFQKVLGDKDEQLRRNKETLEALIGKIKLLQEEINKLSAPPNGVGTVHEITPDGKVWILTGGRKMRVNILPKIDIKSLQRGQEVILNETFNIIEVGKVETQGEVVTVAEIMEDGFRVKITRRMDESQIAELAETLRIPPPKVGDLLLFDSRSGYCVERLPKKEAQDLLLFEVPTVTYKDIGGLGPEIEKIRDAIELPFLHALEFQLFRLSAPKGVLLYGPPGCGKTLAAKAIANSLARAVEKKTGQPTQGFFITIKGPELLTKWVGDTERKIREIFQRAREKAKEGMPVLIFFDELESMLRTRGSGISSDVESTIVPQFLAEIDGIEGLKNVIVLGASNRQDLIDPAVLRPGRFDVKIEIGRPDRQGIKEILDIYLTPDLPLHPKYTDPKHKEFKEIYRAFQGDPAKIIEHIIARATERICATDTEPFTYKLYGKDISANNKILKVIKRNGEVIYLYVKDFASGAMIQSIVMRAKKIAVKRMIEGGEKGLKTGDLGRATEEETRENQDLPNTSAGAEDWLRTQGHKGDIVHVEVVDRKQGKERPIEKLAPGQYL